MGEPGRAARRPIAVPSLDTVRALPKSALQAWGSVPAWRRRTLWLALALSLAVHLVFSWWAPELPNAQNEEPLAVTIRELPPPPVPPPVVATEVPKEHPRAAPHAKRSPRPRPTPPDAAAITVPGPGIPAETPSAVAAGAAPPSHVDAPVAPAPPTEELADNGVEAITAKSLPPRVDLAYKVFFGTRGFQIGEATYRFEHAGTHYRISTVGQALGLAALLMRGQGRIESAGLITPTGLQPLEFSVERFNGRGREKARFDWERGVVTLDGDKVAGLEPPAFDPLTLMWQYYFTPPDADRIAFSLATTRRVARYTVTREGREQVEWGNGSIVAERWVRVSDDGRTEAYAWLAPDLRFIPVKMRVTNTSRGTLEAVLDAIRVDDTGETVGRDDMPLRASPPSETHDRGSHASMPGYSPPGSTFPSMTP